MSNRDRRRQLSWAYGVTTVPQRRGELLPRTLASLAAAGFDQPRLFVDGCNSADVSGWEEEFKLPVTARWPIMRTFGNWLLSAIELYIRRPDVNRYAIFQDDFVTYPGLREYLDHCHYPDGQSRSSSEINLNDPLPRGYWNLYTFPENQALAPRTSSGGTVDGWYPSNQLGKGAVALVFNRDALLTLVTHSHMLERPQDERRGWKAVDGGIVTAMSKAGWIEYVHSPSLTQHIGHVSSMGNRQHQQAESFRGDQWDVRQLLARR
jgi:hypothetical protein